MWWTAARRCAVWPVAEQETCQLVPDTAIFDVDGTLVDSNYQHALAWFRAFRRYDITLPLWRLHRGIGMGGDLYVEHLAGERRRARAR